MSVAPTCPSTGILERFIDRAGGGDQLIVGI
jgi:hypothetical protein